MDSDSNFFQMMLFVISKTVLLLTQFFFFGNLANLKRVSSETSKLISEMFEYIGVWLPILDV